MHDLASLLGYKPAALAYLLYKIPPEHRYETFEIKKRSGGIRKIDAPDPRIKLLQQRLTKLLTECRREIEKSQSEILKKNGKQFKPISHGFRKDHSIVTNAIPHTKHRFVLNLDLENFFPTFNFGRVRGFFLKNRDFALNKSVATMIAQIACHNNALPQGSPCSPIISDLITHLLDVRLAQLARKWGCTYTRYADDLTFSTNQKFFPEALATQKLFLTDWKLGKVLVSEIEKAGFKINPHKTRMQTHSGRQTVTGLTVNQKANIHANYYRFARAMCHQLFFTGKYFQPHSSKLIHRKERFDSKNMFLKFFGLAISTLSRKRIRTTVLSEKQKNKPEISSLGQLNGILNHIYYVKRKSELRAQQSTRIKNKDFAGIKLLYQKFLFFKFFVALSRPLLVCEGKTDNVYLRLALRKQGLKYPQLFNGAEANQKIQAQFFNHSNIAKELLKLGGGSAGQASLIREFKRLIDQYNHRPLLHPVIILIDNDQGADCVFKAAKSTFDVTIAHADNAPFYHLSHNLYLIKTPESAVAKKHQSCIEDLFDPALLGTILNGCKFNPDKDHDAPGEYGKAVFAKNVIAKNVKTVDFSNFDQIFDRIIAVLNHYSAPTNPPA